MTETTIDTQQDAKPFSFKLLKTDGMARRGEITTPHGKVRTPALCQLARKRR